MDLISMWLLDCWFSKELGYGRLRLWRSIKLNVKRNHNIIRSGHRWIWATDSQTTTDRSEFHFRSQFFLKCYFECAHVYLQIIGWREFTNLLKVVPARIPNLPQRLIIHSEILRNSLAYLSTWLPDDFYRDLLAIRRTVCKPEFECTWKSMKYVHKYSEWYQYITVKWW